MKRLIFAVLICTILVLAVFTGCQSNPSYFGQVDSIDGNTIDILLLTPPFGLGLDIFSGDFTGGPYGSGGLVLTGDAITFTVSDKTIVNIWGPYKNTQSSKSEIEVGDMVNVTLSNNNAKIVTILEIGGPEDYTSEDTSSPSPSAS